MKRILVAASVLAAAVVSLGAASALAGKPDPSKLEIAPSSYDFGTVEPGSSTNATDFVLKYTGKGNSGRLSIGGLVDGWTIASNTCSGASLANNETCTVRIAWEPTTYGLIGDDTLQISGRKLSATATLLGESPAPSCTSGSENFSGYDDFELTFDFSGGRIYVPVENVYTGVRIVPDSWGSNGQFTDGTHVYYTGVGANSVELTFDAARLGYAPVGWVQLDVQSAAFPGTADTTETLTAYDSSDAVIDTDSATSHNLKNTLSVQSSSDNIDHFTIATNDPDARGFGFTNISWGCVPL